MSSALREEEWTDLLGLIEEYETCIHWHKVIKPYCRFKYEKEVCKGQREFLKSHNNGFPSVEIRSSSSNVKLKLELLDEFHNPHFHSLYYDSAKSNVKEDAGALYIYHNLDAGNIIELRNIGIQKTKNETAYNIVKEYNVDNIKDYIKKADSKVLLKVTLFDDSNTLRFILSEPILSSIVHKNEVIIIQHYSPSEVIDTENKVLIVVLEKKINTRNEDIKAYLISEELRKEEKYLTLKKGNGATYVFEFPRIQPVQKTVKAEFVVKNDNNEDKRPIVFYPKPARKRNNDSELLTQNKKVKIIGNYEVDYIGDDDDDDDDDDNNDDNDNNSTITTDESEPETFLDVERNINQFKSDVDPDNARNLQEVAKLAQDYSSEETRTKLFETFNDFLPVIHTLQDDNGDTSLHKAILKGDTGKVLTVIDILEKSNYQWVLNMQNTSGQTVLILATFTNSLSVDIVEHLLVSGCQLEIRDNFDCTALDYAVEYGRIDLLKLFLRTMLKKNIPEFFSRMFENGQKSILHTAIMYNSTMTVKFILKLREIFQQKKLQCQPLIDINKKSEINSNTSLHLAVMYNVDSIIIDLLLDQPDLDIYLRNGSDETALELAMRLQRNMVAGKLKKREGNNISLSSSKLDGNTDDIDMLKEQTSDSDTSDIEDLTHLLDYLFGSK